ncbi:unnamed protein product [Cyprideis torosa]|uniref:Uncharacterized protein n=1 Tax=Cyprideis torosa TaxID=163714 RepID=A0A7R8W892_9CRUS|nr:unnamed protein product [Cyprideis torosa]CAG0883213.1 unnamed protein product [Cyprideis torosa]
MSKRTAEYELNHENWDQDLPADDSDARNGPSLLTSDQLASRGRVIAKAGRRKPGQGGGQAESTSSVFAGFKGFTSTPLVASAPKASPFPAAVAAGAFSFLANVTTASTTTNGHNVLPTSSLAKGDAGGGADTKKSSSSKASSTSGFGGFINPVTPSAATAKVPSSFPTSSASVTDSLVVPSQSSTSSSASLSGANTGLSVAQGIKSLSNAPGSVQSSSLDRRSLNEQFFQKIRDHLSQHVGCDCDLRPTLKSYIPAVQQPLERKTLNREFVRNIQDHFSQHQDCDCDLRPSLRSYLRHFQTLEEEPPTTVSVASGVTSKPDTLSSTPTAAPPPGVTSTPDPSAPLKEASDLFPPLKPGFAFGGAGPKPGVSAPPFLPAFRPPPPAVASAPQGITFGQYDVSSSGGKMTRKAEGQGTLSHAPAVKTSFSFGQAPPPASAVSSPPSKTAVAIAPFKFGPPTTTVGSTPPLTTSSTGFLATSSSTTTPLATSSSTAPLATSSSTTTPLATSSSAAPPLATSAATSPTTGFSFKPLPPATSGATPPSAAPTPGFSFKPLPPATGATTPFSFGAKSDAPTPGTFVFGRSTTTSSTTGLGQPLPFTFGNSASTATGSGGGVKPFSFGATPVAPATAQTEDAQDEESDEPPKVEVKEVKEPEAFFSRRCKLFYRAEDSYKDKGVGTLHLKTLESGKTQLLVRADTNLGNILLNVCIDGVSATTKTNGVIFSCIPHPPLDPSGKRIPHDKPVIFLVKVRTAEMAEDLCKHMRNPPRKAAAPSASDDDVVTLD